MLNEPRTYRHSPIQLVLVILLFGILGVGLFATIGWTEYLVLIPFAGLFGIVFLMILYSMTTKTMISVNEISTQTFLGAKSLTWREIHHVSGKGDAVKLHNFDGDVTVAPSQQLPGYEEVVEWIGIKRPDLFNPLEYREMKKNGLNGILLPFMGLLLIGLGAFLVFQANTNGDFFLFIFFPIFGIVILVTSFSSPQSLTIDGKSLLIKYLTNQKTLLADEIASINLRYTQTRNGKNYFVALTMINKKVVRIGGLNPNLPVVYLVLKNWHEKNTLSGLTNQQN